MKDKDIQSNIDNYKWYHSINLTKDVCQPCSCMKNNNTELPSKIEVADVERAFLYCVKDESLRSPHTQSWCKGMD